MGATYAFDQELARRFGGASRRTGLLMALKSIQNSSPFRGRGIPHTDITLPSMPDEEDMVCFPDDPPPPTMDFDSGHYCSSHNELIEDFRFSTKRDARGGATEYSLPLQNEVLERNVLDAELMNTEYSPDTNFNHYTGENMERIVPEENKQNNETKSFIPVDIGKSYLNEAVAYYKSLFGHLPNEYYAMDYGDLDKRLDIKKSMENIDKKFKIQQRFIYKGTNLKTKKVFIREVNYVIEDGILLFLSEPFDASIVIYDKPEQLDEVLSTIVAKKVRRTIEKPKFKLLVHSQYGFGTEEFDLKSFDVDVEANYNDDLPDKKIRDFIEAEAEAGLCILHGKPGTGKTYYIRDLIKNSKREFIYMNKECLNYINDSSFIAFLVKSKNSVFIMEDCENVLASRTEYNNTISTLLNLSDGLLGDSLNNKFVCTFNTDISNIDEALLRKGRMKVCYEFKYLSPEKANKLAEKLNKKGGFDKDVPLCDVMNSESNGNEDIPKTKVGKIGF